MNQHTDPLDEESTEDLDKLAEAWGDDSDETRSEIADIEREES